MHAGLGAGDFDTARRDADAHLFVLALAVHREMGHLFVVVDGEDEFEAWPVEPPGFGSGPLSIWTMSFQPRWRDVSPQSCRRFGANDDDIGVARKFAHIMAPSRVRTVRVQFRPRFHRRFRRPFHNVELSYDAGQITDLEPDWRADGGGVCACTMDRTVHRLVVRFAEENVPFLLEVPPYVRYCSAIIGRFRIMDPGPFR